MIEVESAIQSDYHHYHRYNKIWKGTETISQMIRQLSCSLFPPVHLVNTVQYNIIIDTNDGQMSCKNMIKVLLNTYKCKNIVHMQCKCSNTSVHFYEKHLQIFPIISI